MQRKDVLAGGAVRANFGSMTGRVSQKDWDERVGTWKGKREKKFKAKRGKKPKTSIKVRISARFGHAD
jgi:hypothetical protein